MNESDNTIYDLARTAYVEFVQPQTGFSCTFDELPKDQRDSFIDVVRYAHTLGRRAAVREFNAFGANTANRVAHSL